MPTDTQAHLLRGGCLTGRCQCGAVRYAVADEFEYALNCHCPDCRRVTGAAFKPIAGIRREKLSLTEGQSETLIVGEGGANFDIHCKRCGSLLYSVVRDGAWVHVAMGTLADAPAIRPDKHIFVGSKAPLVHHHRRPAPVRQIPAGRR